MSNKDQTSGKISERDLLEEIESQQKQVEHILRYQGFHALEYQLKAQMNVQDTESGTSGKARRAIPSNDAIFSTVCSPTDALNNVLTCLVNNAIVSALLLTISVTYQLDPPAAIDALDRHDGAKVLFIFCMSMTSAMCTFLIIIAAQYTVAANRSVRDSDKLRVLLYTDKILPLDPITMAVLCMYGSAGFLLLGVMIGQYVAYGGYTLVFSFLYMLLFAIACRVAIGFVFAGHVSFYWKNIGHKTGTDPLDLRCLQRLVLNKVEMGKLLLQKSALSDHEMDNMERNPMK